MAFLVVVCAVVVVVVVEVEVEERELNPVSLQAAAASKLVILGL